MDRTKAHWEVRTCTGSRYAHRGSYITLDPTGASD